MHLKKHGVARGWPGEQGAVGAAASSSAHVPRGKPRAAGALQGLCHPHSGLQWSELQPTS